MRSISARDRLTRGGGHSSIFPSVPKYRKCPLIDLADVNRKSLAEVNRLKTIIRSAVYIDAEDIVCLLTL